MLIALCFLVVVVDCRRQWGPAVWRPLQELPRAFQARPWEAHEGLVVGMAGHPGGMPETLCRRGLDGHLTGQDKVVCRPTGKGKTPWVDTAAGAGHAGGHGGDHEVGHVHRNHGSQADVDSLLEMREAVGVP